MRDLLMEDNVAIGASYAGIDVNQSQSACVRRNAATHNVSGIEIKDTVDADVYENATTDNTGAILVFNLPRIEVAGARTLFSNNMARVKNTASVGHEGAPVSGVSAGTGVLINANDQVGIFDIEIAGSDTANIIVSSLQSNGYAASARASGFDPYPEGGTPHQ